MLPNYTLELYQVGYHIIKIILLYIAINHDIQGPLIVAVLNMLTDAKLRDWDVFTNFLNMVRE